ncbi:MAG: ribose-phosphate diphosphokinase [Candidatus Kerfeldbacteria bacterium]
MQLKVIAGPACAETLKQGIKRKIIEMSGDELFDFTQWDDKKFPDGDFLPQILDSVRGSDFYVVQPTNSPEENFKYMKLLAKGAAGSSVRRITAVFPFMAGLRQDRKDKPRVPITAQMNVQEIENAMRGVPERHIMIMQPHFPQVQAVFSDASSDLLYPRDIFIRALKQQLGDDISLVVPVAPDIGAGAIAESYAKHLQLDYVVGDKHRHPTTGKVTIRKIHGDVKGKIAAIFDDILDTGGTLIALIDKLVEMGVIGVYVFITHGQFSGQCVEKLLAAQKSGALKHVYVTDSIRRSNGDLPSDLVTIVPCGELIGEAIYRTHINDSISAIDGMFN